MFIRLIGFTFLLCFTLSSIVEAKTHTPPQQILAKKKAALQQLKKKREVLALRNKNQRLVAAKRKQQQAATARKKAQLIALKKRQQTQAAVTKRKQQQAMGLKKPPPLIAHSQMHQPQTVAKNRSPIRQIPRKINQQQSSAARNRSQSQPKTLVLQKKILHLLTSKKPPSKPPVPVKKPPTKQPVPSAPSTPFSLLKPHTQKNAKLGGLDKLYSKNILGQGQTVAVIEYSGEWQEIKDVSKGTLGITSDGQKERYKQNFLTPIGDPKGRLHPEQKNDWIRLIDGDPFHASVVSSVVMDLAPGTKVLPVSTFNCPPPPGSSQPDQFYDTADALMNLVHRKDVGIINISSGFVNLTTQTKEERDAKGVLRFPSKTIYTPKLAEAFKAVAKAGKVVVLAVGNEGEDIEPPQFTLDSKSKRKTIMGHLLETLDPETLKSVLFVGNLNPNTYTLSNTSNTPGPWPEAQERFVCTPGFHMLSYVDFVITGCSFAAPYASAVTALLASKGYAPKRVINALIKTAEKDPDVKKYGSGKMIRADRALEWLEQGN